MKKRITCSLLVCLLLAAAAVLTGCGEKPEAAQPAAAQRAAELDSAAAQPQPAAQPEETAPAEPEPEAEPEAETVQEAEPEVPSTLETALSFVDQDAQLLLDALGEPQQRLYEASCSGPGDDGIWVYDGVTVFTYLENGVETVVDAE